MGRQTRPRRTTGVSVWQGRHCHRVLRVSDIGRGTQGRTCEYVSSGTHTCNQHAALPTAEEFPPPGGLLRREDYEGLDLDGWDASDQHMSKKAGRPTWAVLTGVEGAVDAAGVWRAKL